MATKTVRSVVSVITPEPVVEGAGVRLRRSLGRLWLDGAAREKMNRRKYRDVTADDVAETVTEDGAKIRVMAGAAAGGTIVGPVDGLAVAPTFIDVVLPKGTRVREEIPRGHTAFA